jgi:RecB family exonuclease
VDLVSEYDQALRALGWVDEASVEASLAANIERSSDAVMRSVLGGAERLRVHGHVEITVARARWLEALARRGLAVSVVLVDTPLARPGQDATRRNLEDFAAHVRVDEVRADEPAKASPSLGVSLVDAMGNDRTLSEERVRLFVEESVDAMRHRARQCVAEHLGAHAQMRVALVDPNAANSGAAWERTFGPLALDDRRGQPLSTTVFGRGLSDLLDCARHGLNRERLCDWLEGPWASGLCTRDDARSIRAALRGVGSRDDRGRGSGRGHVERLEASSLTEAESSVTILDSVLRAIALPTDATLDAWAERLGGLIEALLLGSLRAGPASSVLDRPRGQAGLRAVQEHVTSGRVVAERLEVVAEAARSASVSSVMSLDDIARWTADDLGAARLRRGGFRGGRAVLCSPDDVAGRNFDAVVLVGLLDGSFPRTAAEDGFLDAGDRRAIETALGRPAFRRPLLHDRMRFAAAVAAAGDRVDAVVPRADRRGVPYAGRSFFDALERSTLAPLESGSRPPPFRSALWGVEALAPRPRLAKRGVLVAEVLSARARLKMHADPAGGLHWMTSASALEQYASCPYRFFVERVLRVGAPEGDRDELDARGAGQLGHEAMAAVFESLAIAGLLPVSGGKDAAAEDHLVRVAVREVLDRWTKQQPVGVRPFFELEGERLERAALAVVAAERARVRERWVPTAFEHPFEGPTALVLPESRGPGEIRIRGRLDRIDERRDGDHYQRMVLDYKRGRVGARVRGRDLGRTALQLPLYALSAMRAGDDGTGTSEIEVDAQLLSLDDGRRSHSSVRQCMEREPNLAPLLDSSASVEPDDGELEVAVGARDIPPVEVAPRNVARTAWAYARAIEAGRFDRRPVDDVACRHCPHAAICRVSEGREG